MSLEHRLTASVWHDGYWSPLYAYASSGTVVTGLDHEIRECLDYVERSGPAADFDALDEHIRLTALLHHVEPALAAGRARSVGRAEAYSATAYWRQDMLASPRDHEAKAKAQRLLESIETEDPAILQALPRVLTSRHTVKRVEIMSGWAEPNTDDLAAHVRWKGARTDVWNAYQRAFRAAVQETAVAACNQIVNGVPSLPPGLRQRSLASARYLGADAALNTAARLDMGPSEAEVVLNNRYDIDTPAPASTGGGLGGMSMAWSVFGGDRTVREDEHHP